MAGHVNVTIKSFLKFSGKSKVVPQSIIPLPLEMTIRRPSAETLESYRISLEQGYKWGEVDGVFFTTDFTID